MRDDTPAPVTPAAVRAAATALIQVTRDITHDLRAFAWENTADIIEGKANRLEAAMGGGGSLYYICKAGVYPVTVDHVTVDNNADWVVAVADCERFPSKEAADASWRETEGGGT